MLIAACRLRGSSIVPNPVNPKENNLNRLSYEDFLFYLDKLEEFLRLANEAANSSNFVKAMRIWKICFKHMLERDDIPVGNMETKGLPVPYAITPNIKITVTDKHTLEKVSEGLNEIKDVPKRCNILFKIINPQFIPDNAVIEWTVYNHGKEAELISDMGHICKPGRNLSNSESSSYMGTHYMDCVILVNGYEIGKRRILVPIKSMPYVPRNPASRPKYVALR